MRFFFFLKIFFLYLEKQSGYLGMFEIVFNGLKSVFNTQKVKLKKNVFVW
jgi:hypothetical protein